MASEEIQGPFGKCLDSTIGGMFGRAPAEATVDLFTGKNPVPGLQEKFRQAALDTILLPGRVIRDTSFWVLKKMWSLFSKTVTNVP